jgi:hypothetical protein
MTDDKIEIQRETFNRIRGRCEAGENRFDNDDVSEVLFFAEMLEEKCHELEVYKRAMDSMAAQMICPKMTGLELAKMQLGIKD